jgi:hypothetical protein
VVIYTGKKETVKSYGSIPLYLENASKQKNTKNKDRMARIK